jgi:hypothetical protein
MKKTLLLFAAMLFAVVSVNAQMTKEERKFVVNHLNKTQKEMMKTIKGLSEEQLNFKPDANSWSVSDCVRHITISENMIWAGFVSAGLANEPDPSKRSDVKMTDEQLLAGIESRENKVKTGAPFEPGAKPDPFTDVVKEFNDLRKEHIAFAKKSDEDLRNRYGQSPFGVIDVYQAIIFMSGHTKRHTDQMKEVMANANFPK